MNLKVKYFGMLAETVGYQEDEIQIASSQISVVELTEEIIKKHPKLNTMNFKVAVNQSVVNNNLIITENDEIALLPPFAGG
ncbi:MAG: MoaD/ThiS family protein [Flavobacteriales bacterium]